MTNFKLLGPECLLKWFVLSPVSSPQIPPFISSKSTKLWIIRSHFLPCLLVSIPLPLPPKIPVLWNSDQATWLLKTLQWHHTLRVKFRLLPRPLGPTESAARYPPPTYRDGAPLLTSLQPGWFSFCCLNTQPPSHFRTLALAPPSWNLLPQICSLMAPLYHSRLSLQGTSLRSFLTS